MDLAALYDDTSGLSPPESGAKLLTRVKPGWFLLARPDWIQQDSREKHLCSHLFGSYEAFLTDVLGHEKSGRGRQVEFIREETWQEPGVWGLELNRSRQAFWEQTLRAQNLKFWHRALESPDSVSDGAVSLLLEIHGDNRRDSEGRFVAGGSVGELNRIGVPSWLEELFSGHVAR